MDRSDPSGHESYDHEPGFDVGADDYDAVERLRVIRERAEGGGAKDTDLAYLEGLTDATSRASKMWHDMALTLTVTERRRANGQG